MTRRTRANPEKCGCVANREHCDQPCLDHYDNIAIIRHDYACLLRSDGGFDNSIAAFDESAVSFGLSSSWEEGVSGSKWKGFGSRWHWPI
jgi:hypothetical protein